jgi:catechol 2,3-dioxygenase
MSGISPLTTVGSVHLTVSDLGRSLDFYLGTVGLESLEQGSGRASLGAGGRELLALVEDPRARPATGYTGLYHFALLVPRRDELAAWLAHAARVRVPLTGLSDHFVSEAIYLADPDGHGIEIYHDRPRSHWTGKVGERLTTLPLDVDDLLGELRDPVSSSFGGLPAETSMGHVHLKVADVRAAIGFYRDVVGFDLMAQVGGLGDNGLSQNGLGDRINTVTQTVVTAAFLSAGGYHHHVGVNAWESAGAPAPPPGTAALRHATIVLPDETARDGVVGRVESAGIAVGEHGGLPLVHDPSGNAVLLAVA